MRPGLNEPSDELCRILSLGRTPGPYSQTEIGWWVGVNCLEVGRVRGNLDRGSSSMFSSDIQGPSGAGPAAGLGMAPKGDQEGREYPAGYPCACRAGS